MDLHSFLRPFNDETECSVDVAKVCEEEILPGDIIFTGTVREARQTFIFAKRCAWLADTQNGKLIISLYGKAEPYFSEPTLKDFIRKLRGANISVAIDGAEICDSEELEALAKYCKVSEICLWQDTFYIRANKILGEHVRSDENEVTQYI